MPGFPVHHQLPEFVQTHVRWINYTIQPSHPLSSPSPPAFNLSQHQSLFQWVGSLHEVAKILELQCQHQSFQWVFKVDFLQDWLVWPPHCPRDSQESSPTPHSKVNSLALSLFHHPALISIHNYWKNHSFVYTFVGKVMPLLFNMLSGFVIAFLPRSKHLLISWLQSPSTVILEPKKIKSLTVSIVSPSICHKVMAPDASILFFECWVLS